MKGKACVLTLLALLGTGFGVGEVRAGKFMSKAFGKDQTDGIHWGVRRMTAVPGMVGPYGQPVPMAAPYTINPPTGEDAARAMLATSMPLDVLQQTGFYPGRPHSGGIMPAAMPGQPGPLPHPPGAMMGPPGMPRMPGMPPAGAVAARGALPGLKSPFTVGRTSVRFLKPEGMKISWYAPGGNGKAGFSAQYLETPARYNFLQAAIYRLKLTDITGRPGVELYPTLEVVPAKAKTATFLAHSSVPVSFTNEDFEQVAAGNFVTKVIYLPDPEFQDLVGTAPGVVVSSRLEPGVDPIAEAQRRGSILVVVRLGNIDLEAPNTPSMQAPNPFQAHPHPGAQPGQKPGQRPPVPPGMANRMVPYGAMPPTAMNPGMMAGPMRSGQARPVAPIVPPFTPRILPPPPPATPPAAEEEASSTGPLSWLPGFRSRHKAEKKQQKDAVKPVSFLQKVSGGK
jgi:hypothetical protein